MISLNLHGTSARVPGQAAFAARQINTASAPPHSGAGDVFLRRNEPLPSPVHFGETLNIEQLSRAVNKEAKVILNTVPDLPPAITLQNQSFSQMFMPESVPLFMLHGTWQTPKPLKNWHQAFNTGNRTIYQSYIPEIKNATGIEDVGRTGNTPAYKVVLQDLAQFRLQMMDRKLKELKPLLENVAENPWVEKKHLDTLGNQLGILQKDRKTLVPIIADVLLKHLYLPSKIPGLYGESLAGYLSRRSDDIRFEAGRLYNLAVQEQQRREAQSMPDHPALPQLPVYPAVPIPEGIIDSGWFQQNEEVFSIPPKLQNAFPPSFVRVDWRIPDDPEIEEKRHKGLLSFLKRDKLQDISAEATIRPRLVGPEDVHHMATAQAWVVEKLTEALARQLDTKPDLTHAQAKKTAEKIALQVANRLCPQGLGLGFSQGGVALLSSLLNHLEDKPELDVRELSATTPTYDLAGKGIGMIVAVSSPVGEGIPKHPAWSKPLLDEIHHWVGPALMSIGWRYMLRNRPGLAELRQSSPLEEKIDENLQRIGPAKRNVISIFNANDPFIEPEAALISEGSNILNIQVNVPHINIPNPEQFFEKYVRPRFENRDPLIGYKIALRAYPLFEKYLSKQIQHSAILNYPQYVLSQQLFDEVLMNPKILAGLLDEQDLPIFRYSVMNCMNIRLEALLRGPKGDNPSSSPSIPLEIVLREYATVLPAVLRNAAEGEMLAETPTAGAYQLLDKWVSAIEKRCKETPRPQECDALVQELKLIADAQLPGFEQLNPSQRAAALLETEKPPIPQLA